MMLIRTHFLKKPSEIVIREQFKNRLLKQRDKATRQSIHLFAKIFFSQFGLGLRSALLKLGFAEKTVEIVGCVLGAVKKREDTRTGDIATRSLNLD